MNTTLATTTESRPSRRRALLPLATLLAAAAIAMASGATFTSASENPFNTYEAGTLEHTNNLNGEAIFSLDNLKPGDTLTGRVTIHNDGSLPAEFTLTEIEGDNTFAQKHLLTLHIADDKGNVVYDDGQLGRAGARGLGVFEAGEIREYTFKASLALAATDANQGAIAETTYRWTAEQADDGIDYDMDALPQG